jgi:hypothetical protein
MVETVCCLPNLGRKRLGLRRNEMGVERKREKRLRRPK